MFIIGRWDESSPLDAVLVTPSTTTIATTNAIQIPLTLAAPSTLLTVDSAGTATIAEEATLEVAVKINLEARGASVSSSYDSAVIFLTVNGVVHKRSTVYAKPTPESGPSWYSCTADIPLDVKKNDRIALLAYRIASRGSIRVVAAESMITMRRRRVRYVK